MVMQIKLIVVVVVVKKWKIPLFISLQNGL